jgi:hypothetical protein
MKTTLIALIFLCASAAFGQNAGIISNEPQPLQMSSHQSHATQQSVQSEQSLLATTYSNSSARGERPLWEAGAKPPAETPLGDVARKLRNERAATKKAVKVFEK